MILKVGWKNGKFEPSSITLPGKTTEKKEKETGTIAPSLNTPHPKARIQNIVKILRSTSTVATLLAAKRMTPAFPDCLRSKVTKPLRLTRQSTTMTSVRCPPNQPRGLTQTKVSSLRQATVSKMSPLELRMTQNRWVDFKMNESC